jgi:uncharacterized tellurite resistance protein B-like protein
MDILRKLFGIGGEDPSGESNHVGDDSVARIVAEIDALDPEQARFVAAFAYVLGRVAHADQHVSEAETQKMQQIVMRLGHLPEEQAGLVVEVAQHQTQLFGATQDFLVTREFTRISNPKQREELLDCLFAVSAADDSITSVEEEQIRQIATELGFSHSEYIAARCAYSDKREVLRGLPGSDRDA